MVVDRSTAKIYQFPMVANRPLRSNEKSLGSNAEQHALWLTPRAAVLQLYHLNSRQARITITSRLFHGFLKAIARYSVVGTPSRELTREYVIPKPDIWVSLNYDSNFWDTSDFDSYVKTSTDPDEYTRLFGVRFDPVGLSDLLPTTKQSDLPIIESVAEEPPTKGPPVSAAHLKEWYELYRRVYAGTADTQDIAIRSAKGMFPDKSVARDRVKELRKGQHPRGRKTKDSDDPAN